MTNQELIDDNLKLQNDLLKEKIEEQKLQNDLLKERIEEQKLQNKLLTSK
jgi:hypothetical protein